MGLKEKTINWISPIISLLFLSPAPAVVNFSALQILSSEKVSSVSVQREGTFLGPSALLSKPVCLRSSTLRTAGPAGNPECGKDLFKGSQNLRAEPVVVVMMEAGPGFQSLLYRQ